MRRLVEDVGQPLCAGRLARFVRDTSLGHDVMDIGDREVEWELTDDGVNVTHRPAKGRGALINYTIRLLFTTLPSGGSRWWWS
jgi:hypothetical protein